MEDIVSLFRKVLELYAGSAKGGISQNLAFIYRILELRVDYTFGHTVSYGGVEYKGSVQDANTALLAPSAPAL